jgi:AraC-like DNA-binding protein
MRNLPMHEAARFVGCTPRWLMRLLANETLSSTCRDELEIYMEKSPLMYDEDFRVFLELSFCRGHE